MFFHRLLSGSCVLQNTEFGYSRKDVLLIGAGFVALGYALYYGAQAAGVEATTAGNYAQIFIFLIICVGYVATYILRVANKVNQQNAKQFTTSSLILQGRNPFLRAKP